MKRTFLLTSLLLLAGADPATQPVPEQLVVQVRHVEYAARPGGPEVVLPAEQPKLPADALERSSIQVSAAAGEPFETVAVVNGTSYRLAGKLEKVSGPEDQVMVQIEYDETTVDKGVRSIKSNIIATPGKPIRMGEMHGPAGSIALILTVQRPQT